MTTGGRQLDLSLHLLDRQVVDVDGRLVSKVDDVELVRSEDGADLFVSAILVGPRALGPRLGGRLGRWLAAIGRRLSDRVDPPRIDMGMVSEIGSVVRLTVRRDRIAVADLETWLDEHVVSRIPGSRHASQ
jgi:hypothetical protein